MVTSICTNFCTVQVRTKAMAQFKLVCRYNIYKTFDARIECTDILARNSVPLTVYLCLSK